MSSDWIREHKETNATKGSCQWPGVCVASRAKTRVPFRLYFWKVSNVFGLGV
jgi:hypothetical protein